MVCLKVPTGQFSDCLQLISAVISPNKGSCWVAVGYFETLDTSSKLNNMGGGDIVTLSQKKITIQ